MTLEQIAGYSGFSLGHTTDLAAEHWLRETVAPLGMPDLVACTHLVRDPWPHVAISLSVPAPHDLPPPAPELAPAAARAAGEHAARRSGRAVLYPGSADLVGTVPVADLIAGSAIDRVVLLGGRDADPAALVETRDFVRPQWRNGQLVLIAAPAGPGRIAPFELPDPTPCCADH
nr:hypothetical protein [Micromonospora sp. DSM 115978]